MASVEDRWTKQVGGKKVPSARHGMGIRYVVRFRDPAGLQRHKSFTKKIDADRFAVTVEADKLRGTYLDPAAGKITLQRYAEGWLAAQTFDEATRQATELRLRLHVYPVLGDLLLANLSRSPSQVQALLRGLQQTLAPSYVRVIFANLSAVLSAAVDDERIVKNPCRAPSVKLPGQDSHRVVPWSVQDVLGVRAALPERYGLLVTLAAGLGLRQGEIFGLAVEDIDFLRGVVHVRRQVKILGNKQVFALPKYRKVRDVPLPESVRLAVAAYLQAFPAVAVELPWETAQGEPRSTRPVLTTRESTALQRNYVNAKVWKPALVAAGVEPTRDNGMHALRHFYATVQLEEGTSIRSLAEWLGHSDPGFTLRTYTHFMPASEDRGRRAVDRVLGASENLVDDPSCAPDVRQAAQ